MIKIRRGYKYLDCPSPRLFGWRIIMFKNFILSQISMDITYKVEVKHDYTIGGLEQVKKGDFKDKTRFCDLDEVKHIFQEKNKESSLIMVPHIIGAYRRINITFNPDSGKGVVKRDSGLEAHEGFEVHPSLVQIGYDSSSLNRKTISDYIGSESSRMRIVPYEDLKIAEKELKTFSELMQKRFESLGQDPSEEEWTQMIRLSKDMLHLQGLTKHEYDLLKKYSDMALFIN